MAGHGVPTSMTAAHDLADALYPAIMDMRAGLWAKEAELLRGTFPGVEVADPAPYTVNATRKLVANCAGLAPKPKLTEIYLFDDATQRMHTARVAPYLWPHEDQVKLVMANRLIAGAARHSKQASRDLVQRTADKNSMRWARQLTGAENCVFCAMLASRGAVYTKQTVTSTGDGRRYHDHCDCTAVLVPNPDSWDGKEEADELYRLWDKSAGLKDFGKRWKEEGAFSGISA